MTHIVTHHNNLSGLPDPGRVSGPSGEPAFTAFGLFGQLIDGFSGSSKQIEKNNSKIVSLEKIENLSIFRAALALENMKNIKSHFDHCNLKITLCNALISMFI